ncbi:M24B family metallopeptidase, partial [Candidatus Pelagibacter bacterium]|nr:M24B family metallopeptidase [Candidatus Pelagibacter bacterium]
SLKYFDPISILKSTKSKKEIRNIMKSHIFDGLALTRFLFWIKKNFMKQRITEIKAQEKLLQLRKKNKNFRFLSFPTISGSGPNGAIIHYKANQRTNRVLQKGDIYLVDSGGQYNFGTTDVTRTISLDNNSQEVKDIFTRVLKGHIAVASFKIRKNTNGAQIDNVARKYLKKINLDYPHGTGHGVGYFLNVHEGPHGISKNNKIYFKEGMVISNEPGYYKKGSFGIRIENLIWVKKVNNKFSFDNLTMVPIDKSLINKSYLTENEISWINSYHKKVFRNLKKFIHDKELSELKEACSQI